MSSLGSKKSSRMIITLIIALLFGMALTVLHFLPKKQSGGISSDNLNPSGDTGMNQSIASDDVKVTPPSESDWNREVRGVWVATVNNIDFPSQKGLSADSLKKELDQIVSTCGKAGINTIYFQVRPSSDAFYQSDIYPTSYFLTGEQGKALPEKFDPLAYIIDKAHNAGIQLHAWINPYRVTSSENITLDMLSKNNPAVLHPDWVVKCGTKYYFDPGLPEVRQMVVNGVAEIVSKYKVDGIHFDDYFYPDATFDDQKTFEKYKGSFTGIEDWRRENNNLLVKAVFEKIKSIDNSVLFGIAPMGIWANKTTMAGGSETKGGESYTHNYADTLKWVNDKIIDYICPQLYWTDETTASSFSTLLDWWSSATKKTGVKLLIGHALYKLGDSTYPDFKNSDVIINQLKKCRNTDNYCGSVFYNYSCLNSDKCGIKTAVTAFYSSNATPSLSVAFPADKTSVENEHVWLTGSCNPSEALYINHVLVTTVSVDGLYSCSVPLSKGSNTITIKNGDQQKSITVTRTTPKAVAPGISEIFPDDNKLIRYSGGTLELSAITTENAQVTAQIGGNTVILSKDEIFANSSSKTRYKAEFKLPETASDLSLGKPVFTAELSDGKTYTKKALADVVVQPASKMKLGTLKTRVWLRPSSLIRNYLTSVRGYAGFTDVISGEEYIYDQKETSFNTFVRFENGLWTQKDNVSISDGSITKNTINDISVKYTAKNTLLSFSSSNKNPVKVDALSDKILVSVYNCEIPAQITKFENNPLFQKAVVAKHEGYYQIELTLKKSDGYFGSKVNYSDHEIQIQFKNPNKIISAKKPLTGITIALDPGHGAQAGAACPDGSNERELNFKFVKEVQKYLSDYGATVLLSRNEESSGLATAQVPAFYYSVNPDLAISIHHNSIGYDSEPADHSGFETYYASGQSKAAAEILFNSISKYANRKICSCSNVDYTVSRVREFPSVLLEMGYLSNIYEYSWLNNGKNSDLYAKSVSVSVVDYFKWQNEFYAPIK